MQNRARLETKTGHELNQINHRISWLATSQSFLFVAVATLLATHAKQPHPAIVLFRVSIPVVGLVLWIQALRSVRASFKALSNHLLPERAALVTGLNRVAGTTFEPLGADRLTDFVGALAAKRIPSAFVTSWIIVLILRV